MIGAGPTGPLLAQLIASGGAASVTVADIVPFKLDTAVRLGIDRTVCLDRDAAGLVEALRSASPCGDGYDIVVEATGTTTVGESCVPVARRGGTVLIYGVTDAADVLRVSPYDIFRFALADYGAALAALTGEPTAHKVVIDLALSGDTAR